MYKVMEKDLLTFCQKEVCKSLLLSKLGPGRYIWSKWRYVFRTTYSDSKHKNKKIIPNL